jgi:hypothetical protein
MATKLLIHNELDLWLSEKTDGLIYSVLYLIKILLSHENNLAFKAVKRYSNFTGHAGVFLCQ